MPARRSRSRSRSRSRARSKSRTRTKAKQSPSPARRSRSTTTPKPEGSRTPKPRKTPSTPTRQSARIAKQIEEKVQPEEVKEEKPANSSSKGSKRSSQKTEKTTEVKPENTSEATAASSYEFGGPIGAFITILAVPALIIFLNLCCGKECVLKYPALPRTLSAYFDCGAFTVVGGWLAFQALLAVLPVGRVVDGQPLADGRRLSYRCNGFFAFMVSIAGFVGLSYYGFPVWSLYDKFLQLAVAAMTFALLLSVVLFVRARNLSRGERSATGNTGSMVYDFFMGRELNPRLGSLDLKFMCALRQGFIGWVLVNLVFVAESYRRSNGTFNPALLMVTLAQAWYVGEVLWFEDAFLSTMDIMHEGFGYMLAMGDLAVVPFVYTLQGKFLLEHPQQWSTTALVGIFALNFVGYIIFRGANSQKSRFRTNPYDPALSHLETIPTPSGKRLLASGWWGLCRHPNYLGDILMAIAWSLPCGFSHALPWFYPVYLTIILLTRADRDNAQCRLKYGAAWDRYCQRVRYTVLPKVY